MMPIPLHWFAFPVNAIIVLTLIFVTYLICIIPKTHRIANILYSNTTLLIALLLLLAGCLIIGLLPQQHSGCVVTWRNRFYQSWYMVLSVTFLFIVLIARTVHLFQQEWKDKWGKMVMHLGLITLLTGIYYGVTDEQTWRMNLTNIAYTNRAVNTRTTHQNAFPFMLKINKIEQENYSSGKTQRITAHLKIKEKGSEQTVEIVAGHPLRHNAYALHLRQYKKQEDFTLCRLLIVKNPWRWWIYMGIVIFFLGCLWELKKRHYLTILGLAILVAIVFLIIQLSHPEVLHRELVPALQSIWYSPHIVLYIMSFILLSGSFILSIIWTINKKENLLQHGDDLVLSGLFLFVVAMLIGSIWAESAWGHFWTWDLKETWALITTVLYTIYILYRKLERKKDCISTILITLSFISLQMCWYGIKFLPAAEASLHVY